METVGVPAMGIWVGAVVDRLVNRASSGGKTLFGEIGFAMLFACRRDGELDLSTTVSTTVLGQRFA